MRLDLGDVGREIVARRQLDDDEDEDADPDQRPHHVMRRRTRKAITRIAPVVYSR